MFSRQLVGQLLLGHAPPTAHALHASGGAVRSSTSPVRGSSPARHGEVSRLQSIATDSAPPEANGVRSGGAFRRVLVCLDRSEAAASTLPLATYLAQVDGASLTLLHVLESRADAAEVRPTDALDWEIAREEAHTYLERASQPPRTSGVPTEPVVVEGSAAHRVTSLALELDADLIVLSTHGKGGVDAWRLGSTVQKVLALVHGSVLIVPAASHEPVPSVPPKRIFVPLDGSLRSECALPTAVRLARAADAEIVLVHVVREPLRTEILCTNEDLALARQLVSRQSTRADEYLQTLKSRLSSDAVRSRVVVSRATDHLDKLVNLVTAEEADLVVLSAHGASCNSQCQFGNVASHFLAHSGAPVLVIQDLPAQRRSTPPPPATPLIPRSRDDVAR